jgi:CRISPR/Cas system CMR subunit Cmr6 (Cas7 group RAMP superfamily)
MKQTRFKTVVGFGIIISILTAFAIYKDMNDVALIGVGSLAGIVAHYMHSETKRPSKKSNPLNSSEEI